MKTNSKQVKEAVRKYILESIDTTGYDQHDGTLKTSLEIIVKHVIEHAFYGNNLRRLGTYQACFIDHLMGLPSYFAFDFSHHDIMKRMESFGLPLPEGKTEESGEELYWYLIFREFSAILKENGLHLC